MIDMQPEGWMERIGSNRLAASLRPMANCRRNTDCDINKSQPQRNIMT
jgi:hypothetical protein